MRFVNPTYLLFLIVIPILVWYQRAMGRGLIIPFSSIQTFKGYRSWSVRLRRVIENLWIGVLVLTILALARPQVIGGAIGLPTEGIGIVLAMDISGSMKAEEMEVRLNQIKKVAKEFIKGRKEDRIGLVAFAGTSVMVCPLTRDYKLLADFIDTLRFGMLQEGTAMGMGITNAVNILRGGKDEGSSTLRGKIIILLSDGINNSGEIDPLTAARLAKAVGVKVYTIEEGSSLEHYLIQRQTGWGIDIDLLRQVAETSGGRHFKIPSPKDLLEVYREIERIEKTRLTEEGFAYKEVYPYLVVTALGLFVGGMVLLNTRFRRL